jgi:hypothetical protein
LESPDHRSGRPRNFVLAALLFLPWTLLAQDGRLLATGGATSIEGAAGGGLVPWAILGSLATRDEIGGTAYYTWVDSGDYTLHSIGAAATFRNRVEISATRQKLSLGTLAILLESPGAHLEQDIFGAKVRIAGDAVYTTMPQISAGILYKRNVDDTLPKALGAKDGSGVDVYGSATKVFLGALGGRNAVVTVTGRATRANQLGLLGFGGDLGDGYSLQPEVSAALFLSPSVVIGAEYRSKPDNLSFSEEDDWNDFFIGYFPKKSLAIVVAHAQLGTIATIPDQSGIYLSLQGTF